VNEAGMIPKLLEIRDYIITPTLIDMQGDEYYAGTPKGMNGFFRLFNINSESWAHWQMNSYVNPHIPARELDALKLTMTERAFQQEIMAEFLEDGGGVFRFVRDAATLNPKPPRKDGQYVIGVDWGRTNDATVFIVLEIGANKVRRMDRMTDTDYASQRMRLKVLSNSYNNAIVLAEANSIGQPNIEALQLMGVPVQGFMTTNASKAEIIQALELAFERKQLEILDDEILINELMSYASERLPSGLVRYSAPEGMHDDCVIAMALAWYAGNIQAQWTSY